MLHVRKWDSIGDLWTCSYVVDEVRTVANILDILERQKISLSFPADSPEVFR